MDLNLMMKWVLTGGGAGVIAYLLIEYWPWANGLEKRPKQIVAWIISGVLGMGAWALLVVLELEASPVGAEAWIIALINVAIAAATGAKVLHTAFNLGKSDSP